MPVAALAALSVVLLAGTASAQQGDGFLDNLFNRGGDQQQSAPPAATPGAVDAGLNARMDRIENALRQLTGTVEELQHQNQMLQMQLQQRGGATAQPQHGPGRAPINGAMPGRRSEAFTPGQQPNAPVAVPSVAQAAAPSRGDAFNPALHPNAPGVPRALNREVPGAAPVEAPIGAPGGRAAGAPLDLTSLAPNGGPVPGPTATGAMSGRLPPPPPRNPSATGVKLATLPPSASPKDEYELAYGYVLHKDYGLATQAFRDFLRKYPKDELAPGAQYWLGESLYQQQRYEDAARAFLTVSTKYTHYSKAPESLLRLGQSLAGMHQKDAACATLGAVKNKYPHASASVKRAVAQEQKRVHC
ncbi:MAG TPA: tol-pal system protein YbgF [Burkholderiales bacterium]|nr:tol-pal system protein YbgF [Burkholderiales bacterium]